MSNRWLSQGQQRFVKDYVLKFREAKTNGTVTAFYDDFFANWFANYPELNNAVPNANTVDDLSQEDKGELEWHINNRKAVSFLRPSLKIYSHIFQQLRKALGWAAWMFA
jgi:hypothetical protein